MPHRPDLNHPSGSDRFDLRPIDDEGVLFDATTGQVLWLNEAAFQIWDSFLRGIPVEGIEEALSHRYGISPEAARADVNLALTIPAHQPGPRKTDIEYRVSSDGRFLGVTPDGPVLELSATGDRLELLRSVSRVELETYLRSLTPKLLALAGEVALHASAVMRDGRVVAFLGASGAGKTTTAYAFGVGAASVVSEDVVVVRLNEGRLEAVTNVEPALVNWAVRAARESTTTAGDIIRFTPWQGNESIGSAPLIALHFLDRESRRGWVIKHTPVSRAEATALLFGNSFVGSIAAAPRAVHVDRVLNIASMIPAYRTELPDGVARLGEIAAGHRAIWLSAIP